MLDYTDQFKVLRHIRVDRASARAADYLIKEYDLRKKSIDPVFNRPRADVIDPKSGWIDTDVPRDDDVTREIMELTDGFALAHSYGGIIRQFKSLQDAERARHSAKPNFDVQIEGLDDDLMVETEDEVAPVARKR